MSKMLVIEGVMGVGKSTLLHRISDELGIQYIEQDFEHNICLNDFYAGIDCAFQKQMIFLFSNFHQLYMAEQHMTFFASDFCFERSLIMSKNSLDDSSLPLYLYKDCYSFLLRKLKYEKLIVFLYGDKDSIVERIKRRGRANENNVTAEYIEQCQNALINGLDELHARQVVTINTDEVDILSPECIGYLLPIITEFMESA